MDTRKILVLLMVSGILQGAPAEESADKFAVYFQSTYVEQNTTGFHAPYSGPNSLSPARGRETVDVTMFAGARLWSDAELWVNPEVDQGFGLNNTLGVAGFPSAEAYKIGRNQPYFRLPRAFVRQTINFGDPSESVEAGANQFGGYRSPDRLVLTLGKLSVVDIFDTNRYAHDPRGDFLNWSVVDAGSFDYAADAWGYTVGAAVELYEEPWAFRVGAFDLSDVPNSPHLDPGAHELQIVGEIEKRHEIFGLPGKVALTAFNTRGRMGLLDDAINITGETGAPVDIAAVRRYRSRFGMSLNLEQQLADSLGAFARAGKAAGNVEAYEFTDIDRTIQVGLSMQGSGWKRPHDTLALATVVNGISGTRERYLNAGGLGILVGDGQLPHPGPEKIVETYYNLEAFPWLQLTLDYQHVNNPGYNRDRGPASILAFRIHVQFGIH